MQLTPYLIFTGNAEEVLNFYKDVFNGEILMLSRYGDSPSPVEDDWKNKIIHARLKFDDNLLMLSDGNKNDQSLPNESVQLSVEVEDENRIKEVFDKLSAGGKVKLPLGKQFWGATFGMLVDKFGVHWMLNHEEKKQ